MSINGDMIIRRHIYIQRYADGISGKATDLYKDPDKELLSIYRVWLEDATEKDLLDLQIGNRRNKRVHELMLSIDAIDDDTVKGIKEFVLGTAISLAKSELSLMSEALGKEINSNSSDLIKRPILGLPISSHWEEFSRRWINHRIGVMVTAIQSGEDPIKAFRGSRDEKYKNGSIFTRNRAIVREAGTMVNGVVNNVRDEAYIKAGVTEEDFLATLDHRTCMRCGNAEENGPYPKGKGPIPPLHKNCRCLRVPAGTTSIRPYVQDKRPVSEIPVSEREGKIGETKLSYGEWFKTESATSQKSILGPTRYEMYKSGSLKLDQFTSDGELRILTIDELDRLTRTT